MGALLKDEADIYDSWAFNGKMNNDMMEQWLPTLNGLMEVDPKALYAQSTIHSAMAESVAQDSELMVQLKELAERTNKTPMACLHRRAYLIRVMLGHLRNKFRDNRESASSMSENFTKAKELVRSTSKKALRSGPCPFPAFEQDTQDADDDDDEGEGEDSNAISPILVATYYDPMLKHAYRLYQDGELQEALWYETGDNGFIWAVWPGEKQLDYFDTEVPNACLIDGKLTNPILPPTRPPTKKSHKDDQEAAKAAMADAKAAKEAAEAATEAVEAATEAVEAEAKAAKDAIVEEAQADELSTTEKKPKAKHKNKSKGKGTSRLQVSKRAHEWVGG